MSGRGRRTRATGRKQGSGGRRRAKRRRAAPSPEYNLLLTATLCLLAFGAVMVFSASSTTQVLSDGGLSDSATYLKRTVLFGAAGLLVMHVVARSPLRWVRQATPVFLGLSIFLLLAVLVAGSTVNGSTRWISAGGALQIQPSELAKASLVLYGAHLFAARPQRARTIAGMMPYLLVVGLCALLIVLEPDLGTTLVTAFAVTAVLVAAGARIRDLVLIAAVIGFLGLLATVAEPYRRERLIGFFNPGADAAGAGFQALQAKIALGSGGVFGVGVGDGVQKAFYLPEAHTDMIAAVIGEELGLIGIVGIVGLFGLFGYAGLRVAKGARDRYGKLLVAGLTSLILVQAVVNLFAVMGMAPLTGVPLPFVSYGNSSLLVSLFAVGLILNVARGGSAGAARSRRPRTGKLRVLDGGRSSASGRSRSASSRQSRDSRGRDRRPRRAGHGGRRRASR